MVVNRQIRRWYHCRWFLRYILNDNSSGEQCAVRKAFPSLQIPETEVTHLLYRVNSRRTIVLVHVMNVAAINRSVKLF